MLDIAYQIYMKFEQYPDALRVALRMEKSLVSYMLSQKDYCLNFQCLLRNTCGMQLVEQTLSACKDALMLQQLCYILAREVKCNFMCVYKDPFISCSYNLTHLISEKAYSFIEV